MKKKQRIGDNFLWSQKRVSTYFEKKNVKECQHIANFIASQHCKNFWVRTTQKNVVKDDPKILGTDAPNPNFLGQKIWVAATQKIWVDPTQTIWVAATQTIWVDATQTIWVAVTQTIWVAATQTIWVDVTQTIWVAAT